jgi:hypothetical protein
VVGDIDLLTEKPKKKEKGGDKDKDKDKDKEKDKEGKKKKSDSSQHCLISKIMQETSFKLKKKDKDQSFKRMKT